METIDSFINELSSVPEDGRLICNPYRKMICRYNLHNYLQHLYDNKIDIMLIGEAPGYRGCALTGIPFTDEVQLKLDQNAYALGSWQRLSETGDTSERSATSIWSAIRKYHIVPLMWNVFPFHPYQKGKVSSNRTPTPTELKEGLLYVKKMISIFEIDSSRIFAIGKKAKLMLELNSDNQCIRHPANDYKKEFYSQFDLKIGKLFISTAEKI